MSMGTWSSKGTVAATIAGFVSLCVPLSAQQINRPGFVGALSNSILRFPSLTLSDAQFFSLATAFNRLEPTTPDLLPASALPTMPAQRSNAYVKPVTDPKDFSKDASDIPRRNLLDYVHGEVGFVYGRYTGRFNGNVEEGYVIGDVGDDKFHITAGAAYENSNVHFSRH
jgi:hypothetical protein